MDLTQLAAPPHTAVLTMELQRGVVGDLALMRVLADQVVEDGTLVVVGRLCAAARAAGVRIVHCTAESRHDGAGSAVNTRIFAAAERMRREGRSPNMTGSPGAALMPEVGPDERDIVVPRLHGMTPFTSTSLDQILRNLGITTVVAVGVSLNLGIPGMVLGAVDRGYQVVISRDAVTGTPPEYADAVIEHALSLVATIVDTDELIDAWATEARSDEPG